MRRVELSFEARGRRWTLGLGVGRLSRCLGFWCAWQARKSFARLVGAGLEFLIDLERADPHVESVSPAVPGPAD